MDLQKMDLQNTRRDNFVPTLRGPPSALQTVLMPIVEIHRGLAYLRPLAGVVGLVVV
jgi:hypothetical protein